MPQQRRKFSVFLFSMERDSKTTVESWKKSLPFLNNKFSDLRSNELFNSFLGKVKVIRPFWFYRLREKIIVLPLRNGLSRENVKIYIISHSSPLSHRKCVFIWVTKGSPFHYWSCLCIPGQTLLDISFGNV